MPEEERLTWHRYSVRGGDSLSTIAERYLTTVDVLTDVNKLNSTVVVIGQKLMVPVASNRSEIYTLTASQRKTVRQNRPIKGRHKEEYRVKPGDSFWVIAHKYNVDVDDLTRWNNMSIRDTLRINQKLVIWKTEHPKNAEVRKVNYRVRSGDSLAKIASKFNVKIHQIRDWNTDLDGRYIHPGQYVTLFVSIARSF